MLSVVQSSFEAASSPRLLLPCEAWLCLGQVPALNPKPAVPVELARESRLLATHHGRHETGTRHFEPELYESLAGAMGRQASRQGSRGMFCGSSYLDTNKGALRLKLEPYTPKP